jgi:mannose/fructose/N-acetylgalactosamine-specific phosphotransferase system component IID
MLEHGLAGTNLYRVSTFLAKAGSILGFLVIGSLISMIGEVYGLIDAIFPLSHDRRSQDSVKGVSEWLDSTHRRMPALLGISLDVYTGEFVHLLGPSGAASLFC